MTSAAAVAVASRPDPLDIFVARCAARAKLYAAGELELQEAVDELQFSAVRDGLVRKLGQDRVQQIISDAFRSVREALGDFDVVPEGDDADDGDEYEGLTGSFRAACIEADRKIAERKHNAPSEKPRDEPAAESTVEALAYSLRTYGVDALQRADTQDRLTALSVAQLETVVVRMVRARESYPNITDELLLALGELLP